MKKLLFSLIAVALVAASPPPAYAAEHTAAVTPVASHAQIVPTVSTVHASYRLTTVPTVAPDTLRADTRPFVRVTGLLLLPLLFAGALGSVPVDPDKPAFNTDITRQQHNALTKLLYFISRNGVMSTTVATLPVVATATVTSKVKTTNATVVKNAGVANALAATDNFWTLTGAALAVASFRRYLLLVDSADAASVLASSDAATAAACVFPNLPADGLAIVGILTVATDAVTPFTPNVTLLGAAGITATYKDGHDDDAVFQANLVTR